MPRLTEVQRGQAIALLMQGQRQQVALLVWDHVPPTKPYDARDVHEWKENQCKVDELADQTRAIGFSQFLGECATIVKVLMQGQRQQVALQFGVNVSTIERLVRRLRDTGSVADRSRQERPRVATPRQDEKEWTATHLWKRPVSIASLEIVWDHVPPTKPYNVHDMHEWAYMW
jgi:hypothetical protein